MRDCAQMEYSMRKLEVIDEFMKISTDEVI
jgi:hypothetical protein